MTDCSSNCSIFRIGIGVIWFMMAFPRNSENKKKVPVVTLIRVAPTKEVDQC